MTTWKLRITDTAKRDISSAADYIEYELLNPSAAEALLDETEQAISSLAYFPYKYQLIDDELLSRWGLRFIKVRNYLAFYIISQELQTVTIVRFLYSRSSWAAILKDGSPLL